MRREGGDPWDLANAMPVCPVCHARHHSAHGRIPYSRVSFAAQKFARDLLGRERADLFFKRYYGGE